jgi:hypothetical protein
MARDTPDRIRELDREIERYREAAILAVDQLQLCSSTSAGRGSLRSPGRYSETGLRSSSGRGCFASRKSAQSGLHAQNCVISIGLPRILVSGSSPARVL